MARYLRVSGEGRCQPSERSCAFSPGPLHLGPHTRSPGARSQRTPTQGDPAAGKAHVEATHLLSPGLLPGGIGTGWGAPGGYYPPVTMPGEVGAGRRLRRQPGNGRQANLLREADAPWAAPALRNRHSALSGTGRRLWKAGSPRSFPRGEGQRVGTEGSGERPWADPPFLPTCPSTLWLRSGRVLRVPLPALDLGLEVECRRGGTKPGDLGRGMGPHEGPKFVRVQGVKQTVASKLNLTPRALASRTQVLDGRL